MKKLLFFAICLLVAGSVSAQGYYYGHRRAVRRPAPRNSNNDFYKVRVGIAGGFNFADAVDSYNSDYSTDGITAYHVGLTLDVPIVYPLSFEPEVLWSQKGYRASTSDGNFTQRSNFIDVPLLAKFRVSPYFNVVVGPQVSFPISTTNTYDNGFDVTARDHYSTTNDRTVLDGVVGVGFDVTPNIEIRARYTIDFQETDDNAYFIPGYRNEAFQIGLGFKFQ